MIDEVNCVVPEEEQTTSVETVGSSKVTEQPKKLTKVAMITEAKRQAFETKIVVLTNNDKRDMEVATVASLSFENQYFGLHKDVPLDTPVELEQGLIDNAKEVMIPLHKPELIKGVATGNMVTQMVHKYVISYPDIKKLEDTEK